jgi:hypothetical protein
VQLEDKLWAIVNNSRVSEGDDVDGATVTAVTHNSVVLKKEGSEINLRLK